MFLNNFDSANLAKVELVRIPEGFEKGKQLFPEVEMVLVLDLYVCINVNVFSHLEDYYSVLH